jgi:hypothetical protein
MLLIAGGQFDYNIGALLRRVLQRRVPFVDIVVGPALVPDICVDVDRDEFRLNGVVIRPTASFMRHDVFLPQRSKSRSAYPATINWYYAVKGWELAHGQVKGFNKRAAAADSNKLQNLYLARQVGFAVPPTLVTNSVGRLHGLPAGPKIQKPAAGGEHTTSLAQLRRRLAEADALARYPRFVQERLKRPELRVYRIGDAFLSFLIRSPDLDYRERNRVRLEFATAPTGLETKLRSLTDALGLDFAAADFMRNTRGDYCFLEVNTQPMFAAFDAAAGGRLCDAIIDHLTRD